MPKPLTVWITTNWKILQEMGIPDHLISLLRNLYTGQEVTVKAGCGTTGGFQIGKGVCQGCILSPCLFNLYTEYIMLNVGLDQAQDEMLVAEMVKHLSAMQETWVRSLGWEDPLEKEITAHYSTPAWKIPWMEEPDRLQPMGSQRVGND